MSPTSGKSCRKNKNEEAIKQDSVSIKNNQPVCSHHAVTPQVLARGIMAAASNNQPVAVWEKWQYKKEAGMALHFGQYTFLNKHSQY